MNRTNGIMEDLGAELGYTAASALVAWFSGVHLYVPNTYRNDHPIAKVIGERAYKLLVENYGGETICLPDCRQETMDRRDRAIASMLRGGIALEKIAREVGLSLRRIQQLKYDMEKRGIL